MSVNNKKGTGIPPKNNNVQQFTQLIAALSQINNRLSNAEIDVRRALANNEILRGFIDLNEKKIKMLQEAKEV